MKKSETLFPDAAGTALFSPCGLYRYRLSRDWGAVGNRCLFVMLNPSTADASVNDPTVRRCIGFAQRWGFGALDVANLFAFRTTDPIALYKIDDPVGPENDVHIMGLASAAGRVIVAWGNHGALNGRGAAVIEMLHDLGVRPRALAVTGAGQPAHPLYLPGDIEPFELGKSNASLP